LDNNGIIDARTREVKMRMLDTIKAKKEETLWQIINIVLPLVLLALFAMYYLWRRKKKYA